MKHGKQGIIAAIGLSATLATATAFAMPPEISGESVRSIPGADGISNWSPLDNQRVLVNLDEKNTYLLTLKHQCHGLAWAQNISVSMSNNTIWAGFDAIEADGRACPIHTIQKVDPRKLLELDH